MRGYKVAVSLLALALLSNALTIPGLKYITWGIQYIKNKVGNITEKEALKIIDKVNKEKGWGLSKKCEYAIAEYVANVTTSPKLINLITEVLKMKLHCNCTLEEALVYTIMDKLPPQVLSQCFTLGGLG